MKKQSISLRGTAVVAFMFALTNGVSNPAVAHETEKFATLQQATETYISQCMNTKQKIVCVDHSYFSGLGAAGLEALEEIAACAEQNEKSLYVANVPFHSTPDANISTAEYVFGELQASGVTLSIANNVDLTLENIQPYAHLTERVIFINAQPETKRATIVTELHKTYANVGISLHITPNTKAEAFEFSSTNANIPAFVPIPAGLTLGNTAHHTIDEAVLAEFIAGRTEHSITIFAVITGTPPRSAEDTQKWTAQITKTVEAVQTVCETATQNA